MKSFKVGDYVLVSFFGGGVQHATLLGIKYPDPDPSRVSSHRVWDVRMSNTFIQECREFALSHVSAIDKLGKIA